MGRSNEENNDEGGGLKHHKFEYEQLSYIFPYFDYMNYKLNNIGDCKKTHN